MAQLGHSSWRRSHGWVQGVRRLSWTDALLFASVATVVACSVVLLALHMHRLADTDGMVARAYLSRMGGSDGLPDVMASRCSEQVSQRF